MNSFSLTEINEKISERSKFVIDLKKNMANIVSGQSELINKLIIAILADGHILLEGLPGLAKTLMVKTLSNLIKTDFQRIQFTPDMLPADLLGTLVYNQKTGEFDIRKGPIFSNIILADEINRSPAKVQSALLEAMQERQITIGEETFLLDKPFLVMATQNPIEQEGTYPLPEAQLDRFMFNVLVEYPSFEDELAIVEGTTSNKNVTINKVITSKEILYFQDLVRRTPIAENVIDYAVKLSVKTRPNEKLATPYIKKYVSWGAGPRASQFLVLAAKCNALLSGKFSPDIEDVKKVAKPILRHRIVRNYIAEADGLSVENIIDNIL